MIDVKNPRCKHDNCTVRPVYNYSNNKKGLYCKEHALPDMIDVVHPRCTHDNCMLHPSYNYPDKKKGLYCKEHALPT